LVKPKNSSHLNSFKPIWIFLFIVNFSSFWGWAQKTISFPERCEGVWKGTLELFNAEGELTREISIVFTVEKQENNNWLWKKEYPNMLPPLEKNYLLKRDLNHSNKYLIDENNGIILKEQVIGEKLYGGYFLEARYYLTSYQFQGDLLLFEIVIMTQEPSTYTVQSMPIEQVQRALMKKIQ
jgi:hypothetical protein